MTTRREAGYATGMWGKWHSGTGDGYMPWQRGFDEAFAARLYKDVTVEWAGERPGDVTLAIGTSDGGGRLRIDAEGQERPARLTLPAGPAVLTVELESAGDADAAAQARMRAIVLRRR